MSRLRASSNLFHSAIQQPGELSQLNSKFIPATWLAYSNECKGKMEVKKNFLDWNFAAVGRWRKRPAGCALCCLLKLQAVAGGERRKWRNASYSCESWPHSVAQGSCSPQRPWGTVARTSPRATQTQKHQMFPHFPPKIHFFNCSRWIGVLAEFGYFVKDSRSRVQDSHRFSKILDPEFKILRDFSRFSVLIIKHLKDSLSWGSRISKNPQES